jgi:hypothetical protein
MAIDDHAPPGLVDAETLERLRRGVPLRLTALGELRWEDGPITHARVRDALRAGLDVSDGGEPIVRLGPQWCYLTVDDCIMRVTGVVKRQGSPVVRLDDGREVALDPESLWEEPVKGLRCTVPSQATGRALSARFTNTAQMDLAAWIDLTADPPVLRIGGRSWPILDQPRRA